ncbi:hypothetical protein GDO78_000860 [Eleutherodactylus coqui]|uniref:Uncharacterized protein n=1 Tax=Eleutherodactylus coqui TaxID=57060 RepID=A0A8J6FTV0_ELECQ|nr:hypothetical protein GDO78_000860 [Eleutherodactylus coqui]
MSLMNIQKYFVQPLQCSIRTHPPLIDSLLPNTERRGKVVNQWCGAGAACVSRMFQTTPSLCCYLHCNDYTVCSQKVKNLLTKVKRGENCVCRYFMLPFKTA